MVLIVLHILGKLLALLQVLEVIPYKGGLSGTDLALNNRDKRFHDSRIDEVLLNLVGHLRQQAFEAYGPGRWLRGLAISCEQKWVLMRPEEELVGHDL